MSAPQPEDLSNCSMMELFRVEAENQSAVLTAGLLELEQNPEDASRLEELMRAAHSLKGAARIVNLEVAVRVAHAMEDCFVAAQKGLLSFRREDIDLLLSAVDLLGRIARTPESETTKWKSVEAGTVDHLVGKLKRLLTGQPAVSHASPSPAQLRHVEASPAPAEAARPGGPAQEEQAIAPLPDPAPDSGLPKDPLFDPGTAPRAARIDPPGATMAGGAVIEPAAPGTAPPAPPASPSAISKSPPLPVSEKDTSDRVLRVTADHLNRLLGLAGESLVESRWLSPFADSLLRLKRLQFDLSH